MASWGLLDEKEENELHKSRLLKVEEKPFQRVTRRLATLHSIAASRSRQVPTPPPESHANGTGSSAADKESQPAESTPSATDAPLADMREDILLDFAAFDSNIARVQFLLAANERERERYAADRGRILATSQAVRDRTTALRGQLDAARATLAQRRQFDELAERITSNKALRTRTEQASNLTKLEDEIAELQGESETYAVTWRERREQFSRIMDESMRLRRLIRDEKEEVERREGMDDGTSGAAGDADGADGSQTPRPGLASGNATPRPDSGLVAKSGGGLETGDNAAGTPLPAMTPARESPAPGAESQTTLKARAEPIGSFSQNGSRVASREQSPNQGDDASREDPDPGKEDVEMSETKEDQQGSNAESPLTPPPGGDTPMIVVDSQEGEDRMDTT